MKVLYIASNPGGLNDLNLPKEINELQRSTLAPGLGSNSFEFLPALKVEDLPNMLRNRAPDVLHFAGHGKDNSLVLADAADNPVALTAEMLRAFLPKERKPRVVYLNACDSHQIAHELVDSAAVPIAIGSTAPITNRSARAAAVSFYESLVSGESIDAAFSSCQAMLRLLMNENATAQIFASAAINLKAEILHPVPRIVADFGSGKAVAGRDNHYRFNLGLVGCPPSTVQVVFFTNDESFITDEDTLEEDLCSIVRSSPVNGAVWMDEEYWMAEGDFRIYAAGVTAEANHFSVASTLCQALERRYGSPIPAPVLLATKNLMKNDGSRSHIQNAEAKAKRLRRPLKKLTKNR